MKQVLNIRLDGEVFEVEDDAYRRLNVFLSRVNQRYESAPSRYDSPEMVERRLASIFQSKPKEFYTLKDAEDAIRDIGMSDVADFRESTEWSYKSSYHPGSKRVFRSPHDKKVGGVCGGLGVYFNIDPMLLRVAFIIGLCFGLSPLVYILLWIVLPLADSRNPQYF